jgi:UDP-glucuronate 4-epimerase
MKVLVTGGAGFIGSHLAERLLDRGHEVVCLDNFNDFYDPALKRRNIEKAFWSNRYTLVTGDILDRELLARVFSTSFDAVVHLAAYAGVRPSIERPDIYQRVNVEGTLNLLERCRLHGVDRFIFASSSSVYGGRTEVPFKEEDDIMRPISPYAATKVAGEAMCYTFHHLFGMNVHALRYFTVYGPRQRPEMAIHLFTNLIMRDEAVPVFGDGLSARDYTYVDDIVNGTVASLENCEGYEVINLGGSKTTSLNTLIKLISERLGKTPLLDRSPNQPGDVPITFANVSRAEKLLGYQPKVDIVNGIDLFCTWYENQRKNQSIEEAARTSTSPPR